MQAGNLRHSVEIQEAVQVKDGTGGRSTIWRKKVIARMAAAPIRASERANGVQTLADADYKFVARYRDWLTPQHRLIFAGDTYDIEQVNDIGGRARSLEIVAKRAA